LIHAQDLSLAFHSPIEMDKATHWAENSSSRRG
jgi:hypothetical protein